MVDRDTFMDESAPVTEAAANEQTSASTPITGQKRKPYVTSACSECKKRKVRCSGKRPCSQCSIGHLTCEYLPDSRRRTTTVQASNKPEDVTEDQFSAAGCAPASSTTKETDEESSWKADVLNKLQMLSDEIRSLRQTTASQDNGRSSLNLTMTPDSGEILNTYNPSSVSKAVFPGGPSILNPLNTMKEPVESGGNEDKLVQEDCWMAFCSTMTDCYIRELRIWDAQVRHSGLGPVRETLDLYFSLMNPHYPCLDSKAFEQDFQRFAGNVQEVTLERIQFIALVNLILAVVKNVDEFCPEDDIIPGWYEFTKAEHLLNHVIKSGKGNLTTIQCLILKASYLLYIERNDWAYDEIGTAVRLCFQTGLHNQSSWTGLSPLEVHMRQRIFWCVYCLERNISHQCGAPYQMSDQDIAVELPSDSTVEGVSVGGGEGGFSPITYQLATIKWAKVCSDMWDAMFGVNSRSPTAELIAVTDARILLLIEELPVHLRWSSDFLKVAVQLQYPHYIVRQAIVLHLRSNHLRLLLRRSDLLGSKRSVQVAALCVDIALASVEAMHQYHFSEFRRNSGRFPTVSFLSGVIFTLTSVILAKKADRPTLSKAGGGFLKAVQLLEDIAPGFTLGRRLFKRLQKVIKATTQTMAENGNSSSNDVPADATGLVMPDHQLASSTPAPVPVIQPSFDFDLDDLLHFDRSSFADNADNEFVQFAFSQLNSPLAAFGGSALPNGNAVKDP
ncbi:hypothetical protein Z517_11186 [Fonsecaea pedrosoi CBS 271.37]|uniref:Zn(2)-C6 fungal-type domain-containing protein n=1 Tax=Fonsecaea pedrosoi CBS 271.37 TaxID=1442368 RepID=A0A0D2GCK2_9EURO|nr:uncharacterized protein Z517_11186 [Fonsecaea pedrosoi CBS 271.37]KIW76440.1 hypothetical protein Z517_11186 [Fonsecaea pedrosoi CBS 271.37]